MAYRNKLCDDERVRVPAMVTVVTQPCVRPGVAGAGRGEDVPPDARRDEPGGLSARDGPGGLLRGGGQVR